MKLKPYPKYKDSRIQWIGEIPEEWNYYRCKFLLSSLQSGSRETGGGAQIDEGIFSLGGEHINWDGTLKLDNPKLISEEYYNTMNQGKLKINDVLLVKDGATIGKTTILIKKKFDKMAVNEHVFLMRPNEKINSKLLYYLICSDSGFKQIKLTEVGSAQGGINTDFISKILFSIPEEKETQDNMITFLDSKTFRLNQTIEKDKKLIELLKEKRTALINHVVTKGLNPKTKMKDSGIDWIGEIPEGGEVERLANLGHFSKGRGIPRDELTETGVSAILYGDIYTKYEFKVDKVFHKINEDTARDSVLIGKGDLLLTGSGETAEEIGKAVVYLGDTKTYAGGDIIIYKLNNVNSEYLSYVLNSSYAIAQKIIFSRGDIIVHIYASKLREIIITYPSKKEQKVIVEYLDKAISKIDQTIKKIEEKITLMEEYKKSLIHHVVTGKVDVRGAVA